MKLIDSLLNRLTMYQITLYALIFYVGYAVVCAFLGAFMYSPTDILLSVGITLITSFVANYILAKIFHAVTNFESVFITALILTLIIPPQLPANGGFLIIASALAMAIKYLPTINKRHIFNPAAGAVAAFTLLFPNYAANWWVGTPIMLIPVAIGGFLVVRKAQRQEMVSMFLLIFFGLIGGMTYMRSPNMANVFNTWRTSFMQSAVVFFATIMFTEPITSPSTQNLRTWYSYIVAFLYATPQLRLFGLILTPEQGLLVGNVFSYIVNPKYRLSLPLIKMERPTPTIYTFTFPKDKSFRFKPGQYMEWTLPHPHMDSRGNRRYLSLASSPTEDNILAVIRYYEPPSSYKRTMIQMKPNDVITAINLSGDFTMPKDLKTPLAFIASGVGITPFRSMIQYIVDKKIQANIVLLFINKTPEEIVFRDVFQRAEEFGVKTFYHSSSTDGHITPEKINETIPDFKNRIFYLSGSQLMVQEIKHMLKKMNVKQIKNDFFPGYSE